jgi:hypothetical protein
MSGPKKNKTPAEELIESLLKDVGENLPSSEDQADASETVNELEGLVMGDEAEGKGFMMAAEEYDDATKSEFESTRNGNEGSINELKFSVDDEKDSLNAAMGSLQAQATAEQHNPALPAFTRESEQPFVLEVKDDNGKTEVLNDAPAQKVAPAANYTSGDSDKTVAVAGYQVRSESDYGNLERISVGQNRMSSGYQAWNNGGSAESNLGQAENLRIAQEKIIELEQENEKLRLQNEELMAASEIIKERSDLLSSQLSEYKNDRDGLEDSFKSEIVLLKNHLARKDAELQRSQFKVDELDSRLKFDMKKIRVRERELENRLELIRAEKNAVVKNKDEQILDLRRKMDVLQMEVESYRQKCVELNKSIESSQESFKRTTRALRLAMANLELQEENKVPLKKVD